MPFPDSSTTITTLRPDLASFWQFDLAADRQGFIAPMLLPVTQVGTKSGQFGKLKLTEMLKDAETERAPTALYNRDEDTFTKASYACVEHGEEMLIDDSERRQYKNYYDAEAYASMRALDVILRNLEKRVAALIFNSSTWTGSSLTTAPTNEWDDAVNGVPVTDINNARNKVYDGTGLWPNCLVINRKVYNNLRNNGEVKDAIAASGAGDPTKQTDITRQMLSQVFDLPYILVAGASKLTSGAPAQIWSDEYAMVCRIATSADMKEPCIGRIFNWAEDGGDLSGSVEQYRDEPHRSDVFRARSHTDEVVLYSALGHLISNVTT